MPPRHSRMVRSIPPSTGARRQCLAGGAASPPDDTVPAGPPRRLPPSIPPGRPGRWQSDAPPPGGTVRRRNHQNISAPAAPLPPPASCSPLPRRTAPKVALRERPAPVRLQISHAAVKLPDLPPDRHRTAQPMAHAQKRRVHIPGRGYPERPHDVRARGARMPSTISPPQVRPSSRIPLLPKVFSPSRTWNPSRDTRKLSAGYSSHQASRSVTTCRDADVLPLLSRWMARSTPASGPLGSGASNTILQNKGHSVIRSYRAPFLSPHLTVCTKKAL